MMTALLGESLECTTTQDISTTSLIPGRVGLGVRCVCNLDGDVVGQLKEAAWDVFLENISHIIREGGWEKVTATALIAVIGQDWRRQRVEVDVWMVHNRSLCGQQWASNL